MRYRRLEVEATARLDAGGQWATESQAIGTGLPSHIPLAAIEANTDRATIWVPSDAAEASRRSIYVFIKRGLIVPMFETLDLADTVSSCPQRQVTTVAPQALTLFNGDFVQHQASCFAERLRREAGDDLSGQLRARLSLGTLSSPIR